MKMVKYMIEIDGLKINYIKYGLETGNNIVLLHGWGQNIEMMKMIGDRFSKHFQITIIDLPGHGLSEEPKHPLKVIDFVDIVEKLLRKFNIDNPILIGHSFGGKISLLYASKYLTKKVIVLASPFKKEIEKISFKVKVLKSLKKVPIINKLESYAKKHIGSDDYRNASPIMRKILVNTVNCDITEELRKIKCPTLAIWGTLDKEVPVERAYELEKLIEDCGVVIYEGCTHYAYLERLEQTIRVIRNFLLKDMEE